MILQPVLLTAPVPASVPALSSSKHCAQDVVHALHLALRYFDLQIAGLQTCVGSQRSTVLVTFDHCKLLCKQADRAGWTLS
jgi:hypothetical protein